MILSVTGYAGKGMFSSIDGVLVLDDIMGFVGEMEFREFVLPYFSKIFSCTGAKARFLIMMPKV